MVYLKIILVTALLPPGLFFSMWCIGRLAQGRWPRLSKGLKIGAGTLLLLSSIPYLSSHAIGTLQQVPPLRGPLPGDVGAVVILGGDFLPYAPEFDKGRVGALTLQRLRYGAHLARENGLPVLVTAGEQRLDDVSGGEAMAACLESDFGLPGAWVEDSARDTIENARLSADLLKSQGIERVALVTTAWHMPRARLSFEQAGLHVLPAPTAFRPPPRLRMGSFKPSTRALNDTYWASHEWVGMAWYKLRFLLDR
ncbi:MAG: YdcF family protein [bacterium]|nr:YdcF family protein [bacterium]